MNTLEHASTPRMLSVQATARALGIGKTTVYSLLAERRLQSIRIGRRRLILADSVEALIAPEH